MGERLPSLALSVSFELERVLALCVTLLLGYMPRIVLGLVEWNLKNGVARGKMLVWTGKK